MARSVALPREVTRTRTGLLYEYLFSPPCFLHCAAPCRDNELFKVAVLARYGRFPPPGPRGTTPTRASSPRSFSIAEVDDLLEEKRGGGKRGEKKFKNAKGTRAHFAARQSSWNGCREEVPGCFSSSRSRGRRTTNFYRTDLKEESSGMD